LDEADRLLDDAFADDIIHILSELPSKRQTLLFGATMTPNIKKATAADTFVYMAQERYALWHGLLWFEEGAFSCVRFQVQYRRTAGSTIHGGTVQSSGLLHVIFVA
jgi:hypothetical protein